MINWYKVSKFYILFTLLLFNGCGQAVGVHELLPPSYNITDASYSNYKDVKIFNQGESPTKPYVPIAAVAAHGNGYADYKVLVTTLKKEAAKLGAEFVIIYKKEITNDEIVGGFIGNLFVTEQIKRPHLYGIACKYSKVQLGVYITKDGVLEYVKQGGSAAVAGLKEGDKIIAINGVFYKSDPYVLAREILTRNPGDRVTLEVLTVGGERITKEVILQAVSDN